MKLFTTLMAAFLLVTLNGCGDLQGLADKAETALEKATEEQETQEEFEKAKEIEEPQIGSPRDFALIDFVGLYHTIVADIEISVDESGQKLVYSYVSADESRNMEFEIADRYSSVAPVDETEVDSIAIFNSEDNITIHVYLDNEDKRAIKIMDSDEGETYDHTYLND